MTPQTKKKYKEAKKMFHCSKTEFSRLIGKSSAQVDILSKMGVLKCDYFGRVLLRQSLSSYFFDHLYYLGNEGREKEIQEAVERLSKSSQKARRSESLKKGLNYLPLIHKAELNLTVLQMLKKFGGKVLPAVITAAEKKLENLRDQFNAAREELRVKILKAQIKPVQCETILLARYVDCESWEEIVEGYSYSRSYIFKLHRQGLEKLKI